MTNKRSKRVRHLSYAQVRARLEAPADFMHALVTSGLLGYTPNGRFEEIAVQHFERYGTQWRPELGSRQLPDHVERTLGEVKGAPLPPNVWQQRRVRPTHIAGQFDGPETGWIAQFYIRPNPFFFPSPSSMALLGPVGLTLTRRRRVHEATLPTFLYPDPNSRFAMIMIIGGPGQPEDAFEPAYDVVAPILDELSFQHDASLPIAHSMIIGVPSGTITLEGARPGQVELISDNEKLLAGCPIPELEEAAAFYREGISSNNPFHQFLALWKCYENTSRIRGNWREETHGKRGDARGDVRIADEVFPDIFAFRSYKGLAFDRARQDLEGPYRVALAHGYPEGSAPKTGASARDYVSVATKVPMIRYMARVTLQNTRATIASTKLINTSEANADSGSEMRDRSPTPPPIDWLELRRQRVGAIPKASNGTYAIEIIPSEKAIPQKEQQRRGAYRGAGHAVIATMLGWHVLQITPQTKGEAAIVQYDVEQHAIEDRRLYHEEVILVSMAGMVAEQQAFGSYSDGIAAEHLRKAQEAASLSDLGDVHNYLPEAL